MSTTTEVVTDRNIVAVLDRAARPLATLDIATKLGEMEDAVVNMSRLRTTLDRMEDERVLVASGGPIRDELPGWDAYASDKREVLWATQRVADKVALIHHNKITQEMEHQQRRANMLRQIHKAATPDQREALGLVGLLPALAHDENYRAETGGATCWSYAELEAVVEMIQSDGGV